MKVLKMCQDMFGKSPEKSIKEFFQDMRDLHIFEEGSDRTFFEFCVGYLGSRGYNEFLDYSLFALKLLAYLRAEDPCVSTKGTSEMMMAIEKLLYDDRHDMYQNIPYHLDDFVADFKESHKDKVSEFWEYVVDSLIECINVHGTGDVTHKFFIKEE